MKIIPLLPLRMRIFLPALFFVIPGFVFTVIVLGDQRQREKENILNTATRIARIIAIQEEDLTEATRVMLITTSYEPFLRKGNLHDNQKFLSTLLNQLGRYINIEIADSVGNIVTSAIPVALNTSIADRVYFRNVMKTGNFVVGECQMDDKSSKPTINFAYPIVNESGIKIGAIIAVLDLEMLENLEKRIVMNLPEGSILSKIDKNGKILVQYPVKQVGKEHPFSEFSKIPDKVRLGQNTIWASDYFGSTYLNAHSQVESKLFPTGLSLVLTISEEIVFREVNHAFYRNLLFLFILGFITLLMAALANELFIVRGLNAICNAAHRLKGGKLNTRVEHVRGLIEVKQLAKTFNEMAGMIEQRETERKLTEDKLQFRNTILSTQQETSIDGILVVDEHDKIILNNQRFIEMWDIPPALYEQKDDEPILQFVKSKIADQQLFIKRVRYLYENKLEKEQEEIALKDGRIFERYTAPMIGAGDKYFGRIWYFHDITDRKRLEESLKKQKEEFETIFNLVPAMIFYKDTNNNFIRVNDTACRVAMMAREKVEGRSTWDLFPAFANKYYEDDLSVINSGKAKFGIIDQFYTSTGELKWIQVDKIPVFGDNDKTINLLSFAQDITQRKRDEAEISSINRALRMLSNTNQALIRITNEHELLNEVCRIIIETGGYQSALVCFAEDNGTKSLHHAAHAGFKLQYFEAENLSWDDNERGQNPDGIAIRTGQPFISHNILLELPLIPWKDEIIQLDYKSVISLPLISEGQTLGSLGIYTNQEDAFDANEVEILKEMTDDLAFGINALRTKNKKQQAEIALHEHQEFQSAAFRLSPIALIIIRAEDNIIVDINEFVTNKWGYARDEMIGYNTEDLNVYVNPADRNTIIRKFQEEGKIDSFEFEIWDKNYEIRSVICAITLVKIKGEKHFLTLLLDISDRKKAEKALQASELKYRIVADNTYNWEFWTDKNNNFIYCSPSCFRITGYTATEFTENPELRFEVVHPEFRSIFYEHVNQNYTEKSQNLQFKIIHKDSSERWIEHYCQQVFDSDGNYLGQRGSNADITEKKEIDRKILSTVISTEESERNKFSQEIHDGLGPMISTIKLYFQWLSEPNDPEKKKKIKEIGLQIIEEAFLTVKEISNNLSPRRLNNLGLVPTLKYLIQQVNETGKLSIEFYYDNEQRYNEHIEITLYRILSELLNNTIKYSMATIVVINLSHPYDKDMIQLTYTDNGKGFNFNKVIEDKKGMGLYNMMHRIETLKGFINFETEEGKPLNVTIELPIFNESQT